MPAWIQQWYSFIECYRNVVRHSDTSPARFSLSSSGRSLPDDLPDLVLHHPGFVLDHPDAAWINPDEAFADDPDEAWMT